MGKYEPLGQFLRKQKANRIAMTFAEIERVIGSKLPASKKSRTWWSNNLDNNVMTRVWVEAGFETEDVSPKAGNLVFQRKRISKLTKAKRESNWQKNIAGLKGLLTFAPGYNPSSPAYSEQEWEEIEREWSANWDEMMKR